MEMTTEQQQRISNYKINLETIRIGAIATVKMYFHRINPEKAEKIAGDFKEIFENALQIHYNEDLTDLAKFYRIITEFKPSLMKILNPGRDFDAICDIAVMQFNVVLNRVRRELDEVEKRNPQKLKGPIVKTEIKLQYFCTVCKKGFPIPERMEKKILNSDEKIPLPKHCETEMVIKIGSPEDETQKSKEQAPKTKIDVYPAELLMQHSDTSESEAEYLELVSVGIDIGSSTSHLVFSKLTLKRERSFLNMSNRFILINREIIYEGNIIFTPLIDRFNIDIEKVVDFCKEEYQKAGLKPEDVDTGAVIVTGETAKKKNAAEIVWRLSSESGKFVSASAGPNFESVLGAMGSGTVDLSRKKNNTILNIDVGGGTSNLAVSSKGEIHSTSCINVGGRLLGIDEDLKIWRIDDPTEFIMKQLKLNYKIGDIISIEDVRKISRIYAQALFEVMLGPAKSSIAKKLMMTDDLDFSVSVDEISFSGGVAELIYEIYKEKAIRNREKITTNKNPYKDIGQYIAEEIVDMLSQSGLKIMEPENKIRATVIGAGSFSLSVSGSTYYYDDLIQLPLENLPVISINIDFKELISGGPVKEKKFKSTISQALNNFNLKEGIDNFALYFNDINIRADLNIFSRALEKALPKSVADKHIIIVILGFDGAKMLGLTIRKETNINGPLFCLDELVLETGDWIDIGNPLAESKAFPITIKSLVFNKQIKPQTNIEPKSKIQEETNSQLKEVRISSDTSITTDLEIAFNQFQVEHPGYESMVILSAEGIFESSLGEKFCLNEEAQQIINAWKNHESAVFIGDARFPIISWGDSSFAAQNVKTKDILVGSKTHSNRYIIMKVDPGTKWKPNVAVFAVTVLNEWIWDLI